MVYKENFKTIINHKSNWNHDAMKIENHLVYWCDASVKNDRCGIGVYCPQMKINKSIRLNDNCSINQAEIKAIAAQIFCLIGMLITRTL